MFVTPISPTCLGIWTSTDCAITFLAPLSGGFESVFLNDTSLVSCFPKPLSCKAYLATPLRVIPSSSFGDPEGIIWRLH
jgi:hypothetical protein